MAKTFSRIRSELQFDKLEDRKLLSADLGNASKVCFVDDVTPIAEIGTLSIPGDDSPASRNSNFPEVVADYVDDFQSPTPANGWQYLWNENGEFGDTANYTALNIWDAWRYRSASGDRPYLGESFGAPGPGLDDADSNGIERFAIAAVTIGESGTYAIGDTSIFRSEIWGDGVEVVVHVNDGPVTQLTEVAPDTGGTFDFDLGELQAGDTIYVAVGPDGPGAGSTVQNDGYSWDFSILRTASDGPEEVSVTVNTAEHRFIGDTNEFVRERFVAHHNSVTAFTQQQRDYLWEELRILPTRTIGELVGLSRDVANDGQLFDDQALAAKIATTSANLLNGNRYKPFSLTDSNGDLLFPDAPIIRAGKAESWPDFMQTDDAGVLKDYGPLNFDAYIQMLTAFYGQADLQVPWGRQFLEIANELWVHGFSQDEAIDLHVTVANALHAEFPELKIGGPTDAWPRYNRNNFNAWNKSERFIKEAGDALDFYSLHFYDLVERTANENGGINIRESASDAFKTIASLDLLEQTSWDELGAVEPLVISEYGTLNRGDVGNEAVYPEALQQWHQMRSITDKLLVFMDRPDRIEAATPFLNANTSWQFDGVDQALWPGIGNSTLFKGVNGDNYETHITKFYKLLRDIQGNYVSVNSSSANLQVQAFRDGNEVHLLLNNMTDDVLDIDIAALLEADSAVESASLNRLRLTDGVPTFDGDLDTSSTWQNLMMESEETASLTLTLAGNEIYDFAQRTRTFYSNERVIDIASNGATATIDVDLDRALSATLRVGISLAANETEEGASDLPTFHIDVNNGAWTQTAFSEKVGREDLGMTVREFDIPISALLEGINNIEVDFGIAGGHLTSAVLEVNQSLGDFNNSGAFEPADRDLLFAEIGSSVSPDNAHYDLNNDGMIDLADGEFWDQLRGEVSPQLNSIQVGSGETQRSNIRDLTLSFSGLIDFGPNAFEVIQRSDLSGLTGVTVDTSFSTEIVDGNTLVTLTFNSMTRNSNGLLLDGNYQLTVNASEVVSSSFGIAMDSDYVFGDSSDESFYALYGDVDGNRTVNVFDLLSFRQTYLASSDDANFNSVLDYQSDSTVNVFDLLSFRQRYRKTLDFS